MRWTDGRSAANGPSDGRWLVRSDLILAVHTSCEIVIIVDLDNNYMMSLGRAFLSLSKFISRETHIGTKLAVSVDIVAGDGRAK